MNTWEISIVQGEWFEDNIAKPWLLNNRPDHWITDTRNHKREGNGGPKMSNGTTELVLPDFRLDDPTLNDTGWVDAKFKSGTFSILEGQPNIRYVSLDPKAYFDYRKICNTFPNMSFHILYGVGKLKSLFLLDFKNTLPTWHMFDNDHVRKNDGLTPCYLVSTLIFCGKWNPNLMPYYNHII